MEELGIYFELDYTEEAYNKQDYFYNIRTLDDTVFCQTVADKVSRFGNDWCEIDVKEMRMCVRHNNNIGVCSVAFSVHPAMEDFTIADAVNLEVKDLEKFKPVMKALLEYFLTT